MGQAILLDANCSPVLRLTGALLILLSTSCHHWCQALKCYTNGDTDSLLRYERGTEGLMECNANSQCIEAVAPDTFIKEIAYKSGCHYCPFQRGYDCKKCHTDFCNNQAANEIRKNNRLCYSAGPSSDIGRETVWCIPGEEKCYWFEKNKRFFAGCGTGYPPNCRGCHICDKHLCNYPKQFESTRLKPSAYVPNDPTQSNAENAPEKPQKAPETPQKAPETPQMAPETPQKVPESTQMAGDTKPKPEEAESARNPEDAPSQADDADAPKEKPPAKASTSKSRDDKKRAAACKPPKCKKDGKGTEAGANAKEKAKKGGDDDEESDDAEEARDAGSALHVRLSTMIATTGATLIARIATI